MNNPFANTLIAWYQRNGRSLPWRNISDPYRIWISEIIMQQTQVKQGYDYYCRFIEHFPSVECLANAPEDEVLRLWQGLGYYSRARNLHAAARQIVEWGGFPQTYADIIRLKGVGEYTAAAIASFAFREPRAVVDGNVYRVLARHNNIDTPIDTTQGKRLFSTLAQQLLDTNHPDTYNQAIMDFGALVCTPHNPQCITCPLQDSCEGLTQATVSDLPVKSHRTKVRDRYLIYINIRCRSHILIHKRGTDDIWRGLYEFPLIEAQHMLSEAEMMKQPLICQLIAQGAHIRCHISDHRHQLSHQRLHVDYYTIDVDHRPDIPGQWIPEHELDNYPFPRLILSLLEHAR